MFVVLITYKVPLDQVDQYLNEHIQFLERNYQLNHFVVSGRQEPRIGGVIVSQLTDKQKLQKILQEDPFYKNSLADYQIIEFTPRMHHPLFKPFISTNEKSEKNKKNEKSD